MRVARGSSQTERRQSDEFTKRKLEQAGALQAPDIQNTAGVLWLVDPFRVPFRGRMYEIPPLGFASGVRCLKLQERLQRIQGSPELGIDALEQWAIDAAAEIRRNVVPDNRRAYRFWRLRWKLKLARNPFRFANFRELGEMLGFLLRSQTTTHSGASSSWDHSDPSTSWTGSRSLSPGSQRG